MKYLKKTFIVFSSTAINFLLAYALHFVLGRLLGPSDYGLYGVTMNLAWVTGIPLGVIGISVVKYSALFKAKNDKAKLSGLLKTFNGFSLILNLIFLLIYVVLSNYLSQILGGGLTILIILLALSFPFSSLTKLYTSIFQGIGKVKLYSFVNILLNIFRLFFGVLLILYGFGVKGAVLSLTFSNMGVLIILIPFIKQYFSAKASKVNVREITSFGVSVLLTNFFINLIMYFDLFFVKSFLGAEQAGFYEAAVTLSRAFLVSASIMVVFFPEFNKNFVIKDKHKLKSDLKWALIYTSLICAGGILAYYLFGGLLIRLTYSHNYLAALPLLHILSIGYAFYSLFNVLLNFLWAFNEKKLMMFTGIILFAIDLAALYFIVPTAGAVGAAWITTVLMAFLFLFSLGKLLRLNY